MSSEPERLDPIAERIVEAAAWHFTQDGFEGASTAAIAATARTSKREIYRRYANKEALFEQVMGLICGSVEDMPDRVPVSLADSMVQIAVAVLLRFMNPTSRGVLVSAIGASNKFPEIPKVFWREGPNKAVLGIAELLQSDQAKKLGIRVSHARRTAHEYILACCGPLVLAYLFDEKALPSVSQQSVHVQKVTDRFLTDLMP